MQQPDAVRSKDESPIPSEELQSRVRAFLSAVELVDIRPCAISATVEEAVIPGTHVASVEVNLAVSIAAAEGVYGSRFDYSFELQGSDDGRTLGRIEFSLVLDYSTTGDFIPDREAGEYLASTTGYFAAYPYARELFQSLAGRLQVDPIVLGLIRRNTLRPGKITVIGRLPVD
jgi:hypothetical protein